MPIGWAGGLKRARLANCITWTHPLLHLRPLTVCWVGYSPRLLTQIQPSVSPLFRIHLSLTVTHDVAIIHQDRVLFRSLVRVLREWGWGWHSSESGVDSQLQERRLGTQFLGSLLPVSRLLNFVAPTLPFPVWFFVMIIPTVLV